LIAFDPTNNHQLILLYETFLSLLLHQFEYMIALQQQQQQHYHDNHDTTLIDDLFGHSNIDNHDDNHTLFLYRSIQHLYYTIRKQNNTTTQHKNDNHSTNDNTRNSSSNHNHTNRLEKLHHMISKLYHIVKSLTLSPNSSSNNNNLLDDDNLIEHDETCQDHIIPIERNDDDDHMRVVHDQLNHQHDDIDDHHETNNSIYHDNNSIKIHDQKVDRNQNDNNDMNDDDDDDDDDDDGPVIVSYEEINESYERIQQYDQHYHILDQNRTIQELGSIPQNVDDVDDDDDDNYHTNIIQSLQPHYPLLVASMKSTNGIEDIMMTCSRILYDQHQYDHHHRQYQQQQQQHSNEQSQTKNHHHDDQLRHYYDISLVREAKSFLQQYDEQMNQTKNKIKMKMNPLE
jgi:hypothetical protein